MTWRFELIGAMTPSICLAAVCTASFFDVSTRLRPVAPILIGVLSVVMILAGVWQKKDSRLLKKADEAVYYCALMVVLFVATSIAIGVVSIATQGLDGVQ